MVQSKASTSGVLQGHIHVPSLGSSLYPSGIRDNLSSSSPLDERQPESLISFLTVTSVVDAEQKLEWEPQPQRLGGAWAGGKSTQCSWIQIGQVHLLGT